MRQDDSGRLFFSAVVSGVLGAVFGGISAAQNGENIVVGALVGGITGIVMGLVGGVIGTAIKVGAKALILGAVGTVTGASADAFVQYVNYEQARKQSAKESQTNATEKNENVDKKTTKMVFTRQSQELITRAQNASSFSEYVDTERIGRAALSGAISAVVGEIGDYTVAKYSFSTSAIQKRVQEAMVSFNGSFLQFALDARLSG